MDWDDIAGMILASPERLDFGYVRSWLERIDDSDRRRLSRLEGLIAATGGIEAC